MESVSAAELLTIPIALIILSSWEWFIHRYWMHNLSKRLPFLFKKHRIHHQLYTDQRMSIESYQELYFVLTPFQAIVLIFITIIPIFLILYFISLNVACLFIIVTLAYFIVYEMTHTTYHLPAHHWLKSNSIITFLSKHHTTHHHPKHKVKYNFNVTFPLFDWLKKTYRRFEK